MGSEPSGLGMAAILARTSTPALRAAAAEDANAVADVATGDAAMVAIACCR
jgi:hypothetical protein